MDRINGRAIVPFILLCAPLVAGAQSAPARKDIPAIAKASSGAIVSIIIGNKEGPIAQGTGFFINKNGAILTNYHVIRNGDRAVAELQDGRTVTIDGVLAFNKTRDVAIVKAHGDNFRTLTLGNSDQLEVGDEVVAIGSPQGLESTVSNGIVSAIRTVEGKGKLLQISAPISHGSSGGPLFNMEGEVVGITSSGIEKGENLNFAIPINDAKKLLLSPQKLTASPNEPMPDEETSKEAKEVTPKESPETDQQRCDETAGKYVHEYFAYYGYPPSGSYIVSVISRAHPGCTVAMFWDDGSIVVQDAFAGVGWEQSPKSDPPPWEAMFQPAHSRSSEDQRLLLKMFPNDPILTEKPTLTCVLGDYRNTCNSKEDFDGGVKYLFGLDMSKPLIPIR